ncbi:alpha/beta hydrolase [Psychrobacter sp. M13]|uniref:alpha/beta hydrolase n=1 Tax=Psychrobacter sp. M13 TaxID=3067275 RepID=UPI00273B301A|nr:alpha/beta hydrolase [Psychrobacter sp. M13]WLP94519.1 alpha/beta hydrolase [Psychrobacter sp. M13]
MSILPLPSLNALIKKTNKTIDSAIKNLPVSQTLFRHRLHYLFKSLDSLPESVIERLNHRLGATTAEQYPHADAHLRLIMAINGKLKSSLTVDKLLKLRKTFATDVVSIQSPTVWRQAEANNKKSGVNWHDKTIANGDGGDMTIRCYRSTQQNVDEVVMLFFHGGGYCIGDLDTHHEFCHTVCHQTGWAVVSVDYRLAPEYRAPTALKDCLAAYTWLTENADTLGASASRIVLSGDSAGGCLATLVGQQVTMPTPALWQDTANDDDKQAIDYFINTMSDLPPPLAQLPLYPVTDYGSDHPSWSLYGQGLLLDNAEADAFNTAYIKQSKLPQAHPLVSVMKGDSSNICPSYIVAAELDILRDEALVYAQYLENEGLEVKTYTVLGAPHGFINLLSVHQGLNRETTHIINEFEGFVQELIA